jgi:ABC-type Fe3+/spermidine/putrescine transport system ATPase subunit
MHQGRLQQLGTPEDIYERPETIFVADFFGGASFLAGRVTGVSAETVIVTLDPEWGRATLRAATPRHAQLRQDDRVLVGLRTEALDVVAAAGEHENVLPGTLRLVTYRGAEAACEVEIAGRCVVNARLRRRLRGTDMADGTRVGVRVDPGRIILLRSS